LKCYFPLPKNFTKNWDFNYNEEMPKEITYFTTNVYKQIPIFFITVLSIENRTFVLKVVNSIFIDISRYIIWKLFHM